VALFALSEPSVDEPRGVMSIEEILLDEATRVATSLEGGVAILEVELLAFERRKIETEAKLKTAKLARTRLLDFRPRQGEGYQCPRCWVETETRSTLRQVPSVTTDEILRCDPCRTEYVIPAGAS
jgi:hypothetical protein